MQTTPDEEDYTTPITNGTSRTIHTWTPKVIVYPRIYIVGGYQWYFYNKPHFNLGLRFNGKLGYFHVDVEQKGQIYSNYSVGRVDVIDNQTFTERGITHSLLYGTDAQFLWDFLDRGKHSFGVHFSPIGFEGHTQFDKKILTFYHFYSFINNDNPQGNTISTTNTKISGNAILHSFYYTINFGIQYYYNIHHQIFVTYRHYWGLFSAYNGKVTADTDRYGGGAVYFSYAYKF